VTHDDLFPRLDPPPGGLAALRARIDARPHAPRRFAPFALAGAAVLLLLVYWVRRQREPDLIALARSLGDAPEVELGLAVMPAVPVAIAVDDRATTALAEVRTANPSVAFYWVSSTSWKE
jgi:hypothetical protein